MIWLGDAFFGGQAAYPKNVQEKEKPGIISRRFNRKKHLAVEQFNQSISQIKSPNNFSYTSLVLEIRHFERIIPLQIISNYSWPKDLLKNVGSSSMMVEEF